MRESVELTAISTSIEVNKLIFNCNVTKTDLKRLTVYRNLTRFFLTKRVIHIKIKIMVTP